MKVDEEAKAMFLNREIRDGVEVSSELKAVWKVMLDIFEEFVRVCEKYDLRYFMDGGSLLGAMRHRGFIPWDDDMDIQMPRRDYDRLMEVLPKELPPHLFMQTSLTEPSCHVPCINIRNKMTAAIDPLYPKVHLRMNMGIKIDIIPIDGTPKSMFMQKLLARTALFLRGVRTHLFWQRPDQGRGGLRRAVAQIIYCLAGSRRLFLIREALFRRYDFEKIGCGATAPALYGYVKHNVRLWEWFSDYREVPFEYFTVRVPVGWERQLEQLYGPNWRIPKRCGGYHGEIVFDVNRSYRDVLVSRFGYTKKEVEIF